jgi:hypothetical protein
MQTIDPNPPPSDLWLRKWTLSLSKTQLSDFGTPLLNAAPGGRTEFATGQQFILSTSEDDYDIAHDLRMIFEFREQDFTGTPNTAIITVYNPERRERNAGDQGVRLCHLAHQSNRHP